MTTNNRSEKFRQVAYWTTTILLCTGMLSGGIAQVMHAKWNVDGMVRLGYPLYFMSILGCWKILGVMALLMPGFRLVKEWAYAGLFFVMTGAVISHLAVGDGLKGVIAQAIFVLLIIASWHLRPTTRKISSGQEKAYAERQLVEPQIEFQNAR